MLLQKSRSHKLIFGEFKHFSFESLIPVGFVPKIEVSEISLHFPAVVMSRIVKTGFIM